MMRKSQLRRTADNHLDSNRRSPYRTRLHCRYVIHKMIDSLFVIGDVPPKWHALTQSQVQKLVVYWLQKNITPSTIMKYMTAIRQLLYFLGYDLPDIDNRSLGLCREKLLRKNNSIPFDILDKLSDPIAHVLLGMQLHYGLTLSESMRFCPKMSTRSESLWITRDIASNSKDRFIPIRSIHQTRLLEKLFVLIGPAGNLISAQGYDVIRHAYRNSMKQLQLPTRKTYRYMYAQMLYAQLSPTLCKPDLMSLIQHEMGLQSQVTLWGYLKNS